ncbi:DUF2079 domain-containing protein [Actinospica robiniae]|uniref:DUF2079 domain-containing protein n=1 Tax=Actinospica robiniae TaxID=304901 RepID=UPI000408149A|nr:DUF2079 domain-containing protein [Actinospica robiniae]
MAIAACVVYATYAYLRWRSQSFWGWDLGIFDQIVRDYAHFRAPDVTTKRHISATDMGMFAWADHFSPILVLLAPLYWIDNSAYNLLFAQAVLLSAAVVPIWIYTRRRLGLPAAYLVGGAYLVYWPLQSAAAFEFHEVAFAPLILATLIERVDAGKWRHAAIAAGLLLLVKEDMGLIIVMVGIWIMIKGQRRIGAYFAAAGAAVIGTVIWVVMPAVGGSSKRDWYYGQLGATFGQVAHKLLTHPSLMVTELVDPHVKLHTAFWLLAPLLFLSLRSWICILAIPQILERFFSEVHYHWEQPYQYNAYLAAILVLAAVDGAAKFNLAWLRTAWAATAFGVGLALIPAYPLWQLTDSATWTTVAPRVAQLHLLEMLPQGTDVLMEFPLDATADEWVHPISEDYTDVAPEWMLTQNVTAFQQKLDDNLTANGHPPASYAPYAVYDGWTLAKLDR